MERRRPPLWLIYAITCTGVTVNTIVAPGIPDILSGLGVTPSQAGFVVGAASAPGIVLAPVIGVLADRFGRRAVLVPCLVLFGVAGGLVVVATSLEVFVALRLLQGVGSAGLINLAVVLIGDLWQGADRARYIGRNAAVLTVAVAAFPLVGGVLTDLGGWQAPFYVFPLSLVTAVATWRLLPPDVRLDVRLSDQLRSAWPHVRRLEILGTVFAGVLVFVVLFGLFFTVLPIYVEQTFGLGASARGLILTLPAVTSTVASLGLGRLQARVGRRVVLVSASALFALSLAVIAGVPVLAILGLSVLVFGLGQGLFIPALQDVAAGAGGDEARGTVVALWVGAVRAGQTSGPFIASAMFDSFGAAATFWAGAGVSGALGVLFMVGPRRGVPPSRPPLPGVEA